MATVCILRHATAGQASSDDGARPLTPRGVVEAREAGTAMCAAGFVPELVLCSSATRTQQTWHAVQAAAGFPAPEPTVCVEARLYLASAEALVDRLTEVDDAVQQVLLVAHNPGVADLVQMLSPRRQATSQGFPPAAFAMLDAPLPVARIGATTRCQLRADFRPGGA